MVGLVGVDPELRRAQREPPARLEDFTTAQPQGLGPDTGPADKMLFAQQEVVRWAVSLRAGKRGRREGSKTLRAARLTQTTISYAAMGTLSLPTKTKVSSWGTGSM
jgi:hypothetical protein